MTDIPPRDERLHDLLRAVLYGGVVRAGGRIIIDGADANHLQALAVSVLDAKRWLAWSKTSEPRQECWLTSSGTAVFDAWHLDMWGPQKRFPGSDRPLANPICLNDLEDLGLTEREIQKIRAGFAALDKRNERP